MDFTGIRDKVGSVLSSPLAELNESGRLSRFPSVRPQDWHLTADDTDALWTHGLPPEREDGLLGVTAAFQTAVEPEEAINDLRLYRIATFGVGRLAAAVDGSGVFYLPKYSDVHPQLRHLHPDGIQPSRANSTIAALVDCAWRWHWLLPVLVRAETQLGEEESTWLTANREAFARGEAVPTTLEQDRATYLETCQMLLAAFRTRDNTITPGSLWAETILDHQ